MADSRPRPSSHAGPPTPAPPTAASGPAPAPQPRRARRQQPPAIAVAWSAFPLGRGGTQPQKLLGIGAVAGLWRHSLEAHLRIVDPHWPRPQEGIGSRTGTLRHVRNLE